MAHAYADAAHCGDAEKEDAMTVQNANIVLPHLENGKIRRGTAAGRPPFADALARESRIGTTPADPPVPPPRNTVRADHAHALAQADMDRKRIQLLDALAQSMSAADSPLDAARNAVTMRNLRTVIGGFTLRAPQAAMDVPAKSQTRRQIRASGSVGDAQHAKTGAIGKLAAQFESGGDGIAAIGYDRHGGTSYGKYQIASRVGSMDRFLNFLDVAAPDMSGILRQAGPANTGSRKGAMPDAWRKLAAEQPQRFEALQEKFIYDSHYKPALAAVTKHTPLDENKLSSVMQEVLWSTAVQHGPAGAARIFSRAAERVNGKADAGDKSYDRKLIDSIYAIRAEQFGSSAETVQNAVRDRMRREKSLALNMLRSGKATA